MSAGVIAAHYVASVPAATDAFAAAVAALSVQPQAWYRMDDASGNFVDFTGHGHDAVPFGSPVYAQPSLLASGYGTAINLPAGAYADIPDAAWMDGLSSLTIFAVVKTSVTGAFRMIVARDDAGGGGLRNYQWRLNTNGTIAFVRITPSVVTVNSTGTINNGVAHDVAATYDGSSIKCFIEGAQDGSGAASGAMSSGTLNTKIGARKNGGVQTQDSGIGVLDEVLIWPGAALSSTDIANLHAARISV